MRAHEIVDTTNHPKYHVASIGHGDFGMECSVYGCIKRVRANGLCSFHYEQDRAAKAPKCSFEGCEVPSITKGLCTVHYRAELRKDALPCNVPGCGRPAVAKGLCDAHRIRMRSGSTNPSDWGAKTKHPNYDAWHEVRRHAGLYLVDPRWSDFWEFVKDVGEKPGSEHRLKVKDLNARRDKDNVHWVETKINANGKSDYMRRWRKANLRKSRSHDMKKRYGITVDQFEELLAAQDNRCAICKKDEIAIAKYTKKARFLSIDHCHDTGKVRGLLCTKCNTILGSADDNVELLQAAIAYLKR